MKTATVRDLRNNFATIEALLAEGEQVQIQKRGTPIALLTALPDKRSRKSKLPDYAARRRALWGKRVFTAAEVAAMRADELEGEEG